MVTYLCKHQCREDFFNCLRHAGNIKLCPTLFRIVFVQSIAVGARDVYQRDDAGAVDRFARVVMHNAR